MSPERQRIAIAEFCGWKPCPRCDDPECAYNSPPDYLNDLNAIHEAVNELLIEDDLSAADYIDALETACGTDGWEILNTPARIKIANATAAQRAEALLRTIGKWEGA